MQNLDPVNFIGALPRLLRLKEVLSLIPVSRSTFYAGISSGRFPAPVKNGKVSFWRSEDIAACIANPSNVSLSLSLSLPRDAKRLADKSSVFQNDISLFLDIGRTTEMLLLTLLTVRFASIQVRSKPNSYDLRCHKRAQARLRALESEGQPSLDVLGYWRPE